VIELLGQDHLPGVLAFLTEKTLNGLLGAIQMAGSKIVLSERLTNNQIAALTSEKDKPRATPGKPRTQRVATDGSVNPTTGF